MCLLTVITPTYNREKYLGKLYHSLKEQKTACFKWLIIDDGSTDETFALIEKFQEDTDREFDIQYVYQKNGGKHTALNRGIAIANTELVFIVDSDDYLPIDSMEIISRYHEKYKDKKTQYKLCGYSFLRCHADGKVNTAYFPENEKIDTYRNVRINGSIGGDKAEVFFTDILKKYTFPVFAGEKFLPEDIVWMQMSGPFQMVHINENVYICDYLENGLTNSGRKMKMKSPQGMVLRSQIYLNDPKVNLRTKIKMMLLYLIYGRFAKISAKRLYRDIDKKWLFILLYYPSYLVAFLWK